MTLTEKEVRGVFRALWVKESEEWSVDELTRRVNRVGEVHSWVKPKQNYLFRSDELETLLKLVNCDGRGEIEITPTPSRDKPESRLKWKERLNAIRRGTGAKNKPRKGSAKDLAHRLLLKATEKSPLTIEKLAKIIHANFQNREYYAVLKSMKRVMIELKVEYGVYVSSRRLDKSERNGKRNLFGYWIEGDGKIKPSEEKTGE